MPMPDKRLFSVNVGVIDEDGIPDARLRGRTDQAATCMANLLMAAGLTGRLAITHTVVNNTWRANIDADSEILESLQLFDPSSPEPIRSPEAASRVTDHATREIRRFMSEQQPVNLASLQQASRNLRSVDTRDNPVVSTLRKEPRQTVSLTTRSGLLMLSLQGLNGINLSDDVRPVVCQIDKLGLEGAILKLPKGQRQGIPGSAGRRPRLLIPRSLATSTVLARVFKAYVLTRETVLLQAREVSDRQTGRVTGLQLEEWPSALTA